MQQHPILVVTVLMAIMLYVTDQHILTQYTSVNLSYDDPAPVDGQTVEIKETVTTSLRRVSNRRMISMMKQAWSAKYIDEDDGYSSQKQLYHSQQLVIHIF